MKTLRFNGFAHTDTYATHVIKAWKAGAVEHVDDVEAERLLSTFGAAFSDETPASEPTPKKPAKPGKG